MFSTTILKNGVKVISHEHKDSRTAYIEVRVKAGSKYCPPGKEGLAHFLEHMIMNGSSKYPSGTQVRSAVGDFGGGINASTGAESLGVWINFAREDLIKAGDIIFPLVTDPLLDREELEGERKSILEEIARTQDSLKRKVSDALYSLVFSGHPLSQPTIGFPKTVEAITWEDATSFFKTHFVPSNITVVSSGGINHLEFAQLVESHFSKIEKQKVPLYENFRLRFTGPKAVVLKEPSNQARVMLGFVLEPVSSVQDFVLTDVISGILNSPDRLRNRLRERENLAYEVGSFLDNYEDVSIVDVSGGFNYSRADYAVGVICEELRLLKEETVGKKELSRLIKKVEVSLLFDLEDPETWAKFALRWNRLLGITLTPDEYLSALGNVSPPDLRNLARRIFVPERAFLSVSHRNIKGEKFEKLLSEKLSS